MPLAYSVDSLDNVPEALKSEYTEKNGKFILGVEGLPAGEDVKGLKASQATLLREKKELTDRLSKIQTEAEAAETQRLIDTKDFKSLYETRTNEYEALKAKSDSDSIDKFTLDLSKGLSSDDGRREIIAERIKNHTEIVEGTVVCKIGGVVVNPSDITEQIKSKFPFLVDGNPASGGGAPGSGKGGGAAKAMARGDFENLQPADKRKFMADKGTFSD